MNDNEIDRIVREHGYVLPASAYISICRSEQLDHVRRDGGAGMTSGPGTEGIGE